MSTTRSDGRPRGRAVLAAATAVALTALLAGCSDDEATPPDAEPESRVEKSGGTVAPPDVARGLTRSLARRADAVRQGRRDAFLASVRPGDAAFARQQATYFDNLAALPVSEFGYALDRTSLVREGRDYWVEVDVTLQLEGYDAVPVVTRDRFRFAPAKGGRFLLASTRDPAWEKENDVDPQPWDLGPVTVVAGSGVLGIFDGGSASAASSVVADVEGGIAAVRAEVPYDWDGRVVVYALSDPAFLAGLDGLPGDDPLAIDAVAFPVAARPGGAKVASTRFVLNPTMVTSPGPSRQRLIRHELTHVALGERQTGAPTWFSEGLAEYVSVQPLAPTARAVSGAALAAAERGLTALPADDDFNDSEANYGISWWACEYLAEAYDESMLWVLLDAMSGSDGSDGSDGVLQRVLQINEAQLARKAGRLMLDTYRPEPEKPKPSKSPGDKPSDKPSDGPSDEPTDDPSGDASDEPSGDSTSS